MTLTIRAGKAFSTKKGKLAADGNGCQLTARIELSGKVAKAKKLTIIITGNGVKKKTVTVERR